MATIDDLVRLVPPPQAPVDAIGDWERVETDLGLKLPLDFKMLIQRYGLGQFEDFIIPCNPFGPHALLFYEVRLIPGYNQPFREAHYRGLGPYAFYPEPGGLLPWARTTNGERLCWLTDGRPDAWTTVIWHPRACDCDPHTVGAVAFLYGWLTGQIRYFGRTRDDAQTWFDPYQKLRHVYLKLSEGELPYAERLRILREALAPTADRGSFQDADGHSRQDHFLATALGWRLTYETAYGHQIRVAFPPEDEDRARCTMLDAAARMGCRVLTAISGHSGEPVWGYPSPEITQPKEITQPTEKGEFTVVLETAGGMKIEVIKAIRAIWGAGLKEAKELVDSAPKNVVEGVTRAEAEKIKATLEKVGAKVRLERP